MKTLVLVFSLLSAQAVEREAPEPGPARLELPAPRLESAASLEATLQARRSIRRYGPRALSLAEAGQLLWAAQGVNRADGGRTVPSAGALYPLELVLVAGRVDGLPPGCWRYLPDEHALEEIAAGDRRARLEGLAQDFVRRAPALIVVTGVVERTAGKYGARAERYVHLEAGHAGQSVLLQAVALGLGAVPVGAYDDGGVRRALGLQRRERPLLLIPVGHPPAGD